MLERFGRNFPAVLDKLDGPFWIDAISFHFLKAENGASLEKTAKNGLFSHEVGFHFSYEG